MLFLMAAGLTLVFGIMNLVNLAHGSLYMVGAYLATAAVTSALSGHIQVLPGIRYPAYRAVIIVVGLLVALLLYVVVTRTRLGMLIRAGASNRTMVGALGVNIRLLYTVVFGFGAALAALGGLMAGPIYTLLPRMGEEILIQGFVVIVIGGHRPDFRPALGVAP